MRDVNKYYGGRVPYGFVVLDGRYAFDPGERGYRLVTLLLARGRDGGSYWEIADAANDLDWGSPEGSVWTPNAVRRVILRGQALAHLIPATAVLDR